MIIDAAISVTRFLSRIAERDFDSEVDLEPPIESEGQATEAGRRRALPRKLGRFLLRALILFAGVGGIHTLFGYCPEQQARVRSSDVVHVVSAPVEVALAIRRTTRAPLHWLGPLGLPLDVTLCRHCYFPLRFELLTRAREAALLAELRRYLSLEETWARPKPAAPGLAHAGLGDRESVGQARHASKLSRTLTTSAR